MAGTVLNQKETEEKKKKTKAHYCKLFLILFALLFFSGIAILSVILENPKEEWSLLAESFSIETSADASSAVSTGLPSADSANTDSESVATFPVYIVGEVNKPGIYQVEAGMFLYQLVEMAGGLTQEAAAENINLAYEITNNIMIRIPGIQEIARNETGGVAKGLLLVEETGFESGLEGTQESTKININTANETQLDQLPGIGIATAKTIIEYRNKNGDFKAIEDIMKIPGIKQSKFNKIKEQIVV